MTPLSEFNQKTFDLFVRSLTHPSKAAKLLLAIFNLCFLVLQKFSRLFPRFSSKLESKQPANIPDECDVLIIGTPFLRQCLEYRVRNKQEQLAELGLSSFFVPYLDSETSLAFIPFAHKVIFFRVPFVKSVQLSYELAKQLGKTVYWEIDDLVYDPAEYQQHPYLQTCPESERVHLLNESKEFFEAFLLADQVFASTYALAETMAKHRKQIVPFVENVISKNLVKLSEDLLPQLREMRERFKNEAEAEAEAIVRHTVSIGYGSGSKSHDHDFESIAPAVKEVLKRFPHTRLVIIGHLTLPAEFSGLSSQIVRLQQLPPEQYFEVMAHLDIALAPLPKSPFNEAKSNIKLIEAAVFEIPCICHPRSAFLTAARHLETSMVCETQEEWAQALTDLVTDHALRNKLGSAARQLTLAEYAYNSPRALAQLQFLR